MKLPRRRVLRLAARALALPAVSRLAWAQAYPTRTITKIIAFPAGGPSDVIGRIVAEGMRASLGQPIIIENVAGAAGSIGTGRVARAAGDGYTIGQGDWGTHVVNGALYALSYDVLKDFEPVALLTQNPSLIVARNSMPADDLKGLIAWLKSNPDKATAGTQGVGGTTHVFGVFFQAATGAHFQFVPYRGLGPAMLDLIAGQIDIVVGAGVADSLPQIRSGRIKAYAVSAKHRLAAAPEIPTADEAGVPGFVTSFWRAIFAPKGTPKQVIVKLNGAVMDSLADANVRSRLSDLGVEVFTREEQTPEALAAFQRTEIERWWPIIKAANIKGE
jgi:tripartite-type tricarboxylate transporter receptor subunit TctC